MNSGWEELSGNKLELAGPLVVRLSLTDRRKHIFATSKNRTSSKRHFCRRLDIGGKENSVYQGRSASAVVVSHRTPFIFELHIEKQRVSDTFYIQRYTTHSFINILLFPALVWSIDGEGKWLVFFSNQVPSPFVIFLSIFDIRFERPRSERPTSWFQRHMIKHMIKRIQ